MSIIPTNLMIEDDSNNGVKFKEVKFSDDNISDADISFNGGLSDNIMGNPHYHLKLSGESQNNGPYSGVTIYT